MKKVKIYGLSSSESRMLKFWTEKYLKRKLKSLTNVNLRKNGKKAYEYNMSGSAITYIDTP